MKDQITLGIHIGHDRGVALLKNGTLIGQLAQERIDRRKHSNSPEIPYEALKKLLEYLNLNISDINGIGISYTNVVIEQILDQLSTELIEVLQLNNIPIVGVGHHLSHAYSSFFTSDFKTSLILVADGAGDIVSNKIESESLYFADKNGVKIIDQRLQDFGLTRTDRRNSYYPDYMHEIDRMKQISLGRKYEQLTYLINFKHGEAGKTMGLASFAKPLYKIKYPEFHGLDFSLTFDKYLSEIDEFRNKKRITWHRLLQEYKPNIASLAQVITETYVLKILNNINADGRYKNLCLAGGIFLNCLLNHKILEKTKFEKIHIIPAAGDDGQAIGAAFYAYSKLFGNIQTSSSSLPYLGLSYKDEEIEERIKYFKLKYQKLSNKKLLDLIAISISNGKIIGILRGRSESGPRALCHRSILADPRPETIKDRLNKLKGRELFRPFAPVVTIEKQFKYFELLQNSPYMLLATKTRSKYKSRLAGITHVDGTARVQAVSFKTEPFIYKLLKRFEKESGYPVILNTSFNLAGDPIVESPHDAISSFLNSGLDILVMENYAILK